MTRADRNKIITRMVCKQFVVPTVQEFTYNIWEA